MEGKSPGNEVENLMFSLENSSPSIPPNLGKLQPTFFFAVTSCRLTLERRFFEIFEIVCENIVGTASGLSIRFGGRFSNSP